MSTDDLFQNAPCGYVVLAPDGVILGANERFLHLVHDVVGAVIGERTLASFLTIGDRMYYETHLLPLLEMHGEVHEIAFELVRADGTKVPVLVSANRTAGEVWRDTRTRMVVFEARERRLYEKELLRARQAAEHSEQKIRELAQTLQRTFIPPTPPDVPGLDVSGIYRPAGDGNAVGGDFYDVFQPRVGEWMIALGDVCGKGVEAATLTAFVGHSIRALAVNLSTPSEILNALNSALLSHPNERFCTVVLVRLLVEDNRWMATVSCGGHPLPLLRSAAGAVQELGQTGTLIGVLEEPLLTDTHAVLLEGDRLMLFTDGLTEGRRGNEFYGEDRLRSLFSVAFETSAETTSALLEDILEFQGNHPYDDIAAVVVTCHPGG